MTETCQWPRCTAPVAVGLSSEARPLTWLCLEHFDVALERLAATRRG